MILQKVEFTNIVFAFDISYLFNNLIVYSKDKMYFKLFKLR